ncbi:MAG: HAD family hydrolase [Granulosicoccus sp.]
MPSNLILDIGNVICNWNPDGLVGLTFDNPADQQEALRVTVNTPDWLALDRGDMTLDEAIWRAQARTHLADEDVASVYDNLCVSLTALPESMAAMARARDQAVPMYVLSNMQAHAWEYLQKTFECFSWCKGIVVSCEARLIKPDPAIYRHVCDKFSVTPESCVFIDDMKENIDAAIAFGMDGVQMTDKHNGGEVIDGVVSRIVASRS